ncbi:nucleoside/nucleotide kinase family protein [soil metagenome]
MSAATPTVPAVPPLYLQHVQDLLAGGQRKIVGLVGPPGAGKSTLAVALQREFSSVSQVVPMDGFHLANVELQRLGRADRKGAPDTFDAAGYVSLLQRLRSQRDSEDRGDIVYAPEFRRDLEEPIAGAIAIHATTQLVITEGNYLLHDKGAWAGVAALLDDAWFVDIDDSLRNDRLVERHRQFGRSQEAALAWVAGTDEPNARLIAATKHRANLIFRWALADQPNQSRLEKPLN